MIEKLSDESIKELIKGFSDEHGGILVNEKNGMELGIKLARDYYYAQIDAQAKTMEELMVLFYEQRASDAHICFAKKDGLDESTAYMFAEAVALFLAAGGRIKE